MGRWAMMQRWNDVLLMHWPVPASALTPFLPEELQPDFCQGSAWLGILPFRMDRVKLRGMPALPWLQSFEELHVRTYVRDARHSTPGVFLLSLDTGSACVAAMSRWFYGLPSHWSEMEQFQRTEREFAFYSRRHFASRPVIFSARYRGLGPTHRLAEPRPGSLAYFFTERYHLFLRTQDGQCAKASLHPIPSPLEDAEADIERNDLPASLGLRLPAAPPVLHFSRRLAVYVWQREQLYPLRGTQRIPAVAAPSST